LVLAMWNCEGCFISVIWNDTNFPETAFKIKFAENIGIGDFSKQQFFIGKRIPDRH